MTKILSIFIAAVIIIYSAAIIYRPKNENKITIPDNSNSICYDSSDQGAFVCGFKENNIFCYKLLPVYLSRKISVSGVIKSIKISGCYAYVLICKSVSESNYELLEIDINSGANKYYELKGKDHLSTKYFSVTGNYLYLHKNDDLRSYVKIINLFDRKTYELKFSSRVRRIFNNNGQSYFMLNDGSIYKLTNTSCTYITKVNSESDASNAGIDYINIGNGKLLSLKNGQTKQLSCVNNNCACVSNKYTFYADSSSLFCLEDNAVKTEVLDKTPKAVLAYSNQAVVITTDNNYTIIKIENNNTTTPTTKKTIDNAACAYSIYSDDILCNVKCGTSISEFKTKFSVSVDIYDSNSKSVSSGIIKTGYKVKYNNKTRYIAVKGDITGTGNVNSKDISQLMNYFADVSNLNDLQKAAADYNLDGTVNNKDLVLIARANL